jgi:hypothetical protein
VQFRQGCDDLSDASMSARSARRRVLRAAVLGTPENPMRETPARETGAGETPGNAHVNPHHTRSVAVGQLLDVSPHVIVLQTGTGELRFPLTPRTSAWRGGSLRPAALREGDHTVIRTSGRVATSIWAQIGRVTGTIIEASSRELLIDTGPAKGRDIVVIDEGSLWRIQVRFPRLEPGYLIDVIGLRQQGYLRALLPATAQPPYRADHPPAPPMISGHVTDPVSGTAVWHEPGEEPDDLLGIAYPALDPETNCEQYPAPPAEPHTVDPHAFGAGCVRLPYLSVSSLLHIRNECSDRARILPVTSCGAFARLFCDRCVECGTSPKGRIADLTMAAFVELGGDLETGCFNASMTVVGLMMGG